MTRSRLAIVAALLLIPLALEAQRPFESTPRREPSPTTATLEQPNLYTSEVPTTVSSAATLAAEPSLSLKTTGTALSDLATSLPTNQEFQITLLPEETESRETTSAELSAFHLLPETPLPLEELEDLTSNSKRARRITLHGAVCRVLGSNQALRIEKLRPEVSNTGIESAESEFDTFLTAGMEYETQHSSTLSPRSRDAQSSDTRTEETRVSRSFRQNIGLSQRLPTGTDISVGFSNSRSWSNSSLPFYSQALNLNITQNLLKGAGCEVNLVRIWQAENNFVASLYQLQQYVINTVTETMSTYWDVYLALRTLEIARKGHEVAREQRERTEEFVQVGKSPPLELLAAQAEEAARVSSVISAASTLKRQQLIFIRQLNPEGLPREWTSLIYPSEDPVLPAEPVNIKDRIRLAMYYRPDLRQAEIDLSNSELEVIRTENGLLPALDLTGSLGFSGSGDHFSQAFQKVENRDFPSYGVGLQFSYPLQNRSARAAYRRSVFQEDMAREAIQNYRQTIEYDVRIAINEIERTTRLIDSTKVTRLLREEELLAENEKFRVGRSTQLLVAQAQRDLIQAQLDEITAEVASIKAYILLYKAEGTTLQRLGITPVCITPESGVGKH